MEGWEPQHISDYLRIVRQSYKRATGEHLRYVWVSELQDRGAVHYHVVFWLRSTYWMPKADKKGWWPHGMTKTEVARLSGGSVVYLMSYIKKHQSREGFPPGARVFGVGGLDKSEAACRRWVHLPRFLQARYDCACPVRRRKGGGWVDDQGVTWASEWGITGIGKGYTRLLRIRTYPGTGIDPVGPYSFLRSRFND